METELSTLSLDNLPVTQYADEKAIATVTSSGSFLPRIQLFVSISEAVQTGKIPVGHYGLVKGETVEDLGEEVNCWPLSWRFKAMRLGDNITAYYNPNTDEFKAIVAESLVQGQQGSLSGLEFLLYYPDRDLFATVYMSNTSAKREAPNLRALIGKQTTLKTTLAKNKKGQRWHAIVVTGCQTPLSEPDLTVAQPIITNFINAKDSVVTTAKPEEVAAAGRAR